MIHVIAFLYVIQMIHHRFHEIAVDEEDNIKNIRVSVRKAIPPEKNK
jgi:hypothetical protein